METGHRSCLLHNKNHENVALSYQKIKLQMRVYFLRDYRVETVGQERTRMYYCQHPSLHSLLKLFVWMYQWPLFCSVWSLHSQWMGRPGHSFINWNVDTVEMRLPPLWFLPFCFPPPPLLSLSSLRPLPSYLLSLLTEGTILLEPPALQSPAFGLEIKKVFLV